MLSFVVGVLVVVIVSTGYWIMHRRKPMVRKELWHVFMGKENTTQALVQKAKALAPLLIANAFAATTAIIKDPQKAHGDSGDTKAESVALEIILVNYHFVDRIAFQFLDRDKKSIFCQTLLEEIAGRLWNTPEFLARAEQMSAIRRQGMTMEAFKKDLCELYSKRMEQYGKYEDPLKAAIAFERMLNDNLGIPTVLWLPTITIGIWDSLQLADLLTGHSETEFLDRVRAGQAKTAAIPRSDAAFRDENGNTTLALATREGNRDFVKMLLDAGLHVDSRNKAGQTPTMLAAREGHRGILKLLLDKGAEIDAADNNGDTALKYAIDASVGAGVDEEGNDFLEEAENDFFDIVKILLESGACPTRKNNGGWTPLSTAREFASAEIVQLLEDAASRSQGK